MKPRLSHRLFSWPKRYYLVLICGCAQNMALAARRRAAAQEERMAQKIGEGPHKACAPANTSVFAPEPDKGLLARAAANPTGTVDQPRLDQTSYAHRRVSSTVVAPKVTQASFDAAAQAASSIATNPDRQSCGVSSSQSVGSAFQGCNAFASMTTGGLPAQLDGFNQSAATTASDGYQRKKQLSSSAATASQSSHGGRRTISFRPVQVDDGLTELADHAMNLLSSTRKRSDLDFFLKKALRSHLFFEAMPPDQLQACVDAMEPCHLKPREVAIRAGEPSEFMYVVHKGRVAVQIGASDEQGGRTSMMSSMRTSAREKNCGPGDMFGEATLMKGGDADLTAVATGTAQLWRLHRIAFKMIQINHSRKDKEQRLHLLQHVDIFNGMQLAEEEFHELVTACDLVVFSNDSTIMKEGDKDRVLYVIVEGRVGVYKGNNFVSEFGPGEYFGEMSMLTGAPRAATIRTIGHCECLSLAGDAWDAVLGTHAEVLARNTRRRLLKRIPAIQALSGGLSRIEERKLLASFQFVSYGQGELVMTMGDSADELYLLEEGKVSVHRGTDGVGGEIARLGPGSWLGENAIVEGALREATVVAETLCRFAVISREALIEALHNDSNARELRDLFDMIRRDHESADTIAQGQESAEHLGALWKEVSGVATVHVPQNAPLAAHLMGAAPRASAPKLEQPRTLTHTSSQKNWMEMAKYVHDGTWRHTHEWKDKLLRHELDFDQQHLESLKMLTQLGKGNFGKVELVLHPVHARLFALKTQPVKKPDAIMREVQAMTECRCGFICGFFGSFVGKGTSYILTEYMAGGDLGQLLGDNANTPIKDARFYFACCLSAVEAIHMMDWIHRDLKLDNVMIANNGYAKVIDMGLAKRSTNNQYAYSMCGTPVYMAPEIIRGVGYAKPADLWSLGVMLGEMISGRPPFWPVEGEPRDAMELFQLILKSDPVLTHPKFTIPCKELLRAMLQKKSALRLGSHAVLSDGMRQIKHHEFFHGFDWHALNAGTMRAPMVPTIPAEYAKLEADQMRLTQSLSKMLKSQQAIRRGAGQSRSGRVK